MEIKKDELAINIKKLDKDIVKTNSFNQVFMRGVLWGVGTTLGTTIVAAIVITLLSRIFNSFDYIPILKDFVQKIQG